MIPLTERCCYRSEVWKHYVSILFYTECWDIIYK